MHAITWKRVYIPRNGHDVITLCEEPSKCNLPRRRIVAICKRFEFVDDLQVLVEVLRGVPRVLQAKVSFLKVVTRLDAAGKYATSQRCISDECVSLMDTRESRERCTYATTAIPRSWHVFASPMLSFSNSKANALYSI